HERVVIGRAPSSYPPGPELGHSHGLAAVSVIVMLLPTEPVLLCHVVKVFAVHLRLPRGGAHIAAMASEQPFHVAALEFCVELRSRLAVTLARLELEHVGRARGGGR